MTTSFHGANNTVARPFGDFWDQIEREEREGGLARRKAMGR
ncbi:hypothetical protein ASAP_1653 [Asaia bogorensis]|uniref:Uncharacterized protein n=1 Tax=Asaia bogorensis TaxID=91915 RepID=A0A060QGC2_9PROT|nr:hypothetical protein ASAP_1653 [Asaia bogorensis]